MRARDDEELKPSMIGRRPVQTKMQKMIERMHGKPPRVGASMYVRLPPPSHRQAVVSASRHVGVSPVPHARYLEMEGKGIDGARPIGFSHEHDEVKISKVVLDWEGDEVHYRRVLLIPAEGVEMRDYARAYVSKLEEDFKMPPGSMQYVGVKHFDSDHEHVQMIIRGRDHLGRKLDIADSYAHNIEWRRASDVATEMAGPRSPEEIVRSIQRDMEKHELGIEHPELAIGGGWKLNINVERNRNNPSTRAVMDFLRENHVPYKMNFQRTNTEVLVASVGSFDRAKSIAEEIGGKFGDSLSPIQNRYLEQTGLMLDESISARFEPKGDGDFSKLTAKGVPVLKEHERELRDLPLEQKVARAIEFRDHADRELMDRYGGFYGGKERVQALEHLHEIKLKREEHELGL